MTFSFSCGDVLPGCAARFEADSVDEIIAQVGAHAAADHGITDPGDDLVEAVKAKTVTAA